MTSAAQIKGRYGHFYREMMREIRDTLANLKQRFPSYAGQGYELCGFVWFQGWNDQFSRELNFSGNYEKHMANFIRDVRRDLKAPKLPFVIGVIGFDGKREPENLRGGGASPRLQIKRAQAAMATYPEFVGTVRAVHTDAFWDMDADRIYRSKGGWSADVAKWRQFGNERPYHYYGSPWFFARAGTAFGETMLELLDHRSR